MLVGCCIHGLRTDHGGLVYLAVVLAAAVLVIAGATLWGMRL